MQKFIYQNIPQMIATQFESEPLRIQLERILRDNQHELIVAPGSCHNHQAWPGGYLDHVTETMNIVGIQYEMLNAQRPGSLPFTIGDAMLVMFFHDIEKPWRIKQDPQSGKYYNSFPKSEVESFRANFLAEYKMERFLTPMHLNALKYVEGEKDDYTPGVRTMNELAGLCHCADIISARVWHNYPKVA